MSTKSNIQTIINQIADGEPNTALEVRSAYNALLNELYPEIFITKSEAPVKTTVLDSRFRYDFTLYKKGNTVYLNGRFYVFGSVEIPANTDCFQISDPEFINYSDGFNILNLIIGMGGVRFRIQASVFRNLEPLLPNKDYIFNISYPTLP